MTPPTEQLAALLQLTSPALPIGGYSYSQGLESAIELGLVHDEETAGQWISDQLEHVLGYGEAPLWVSLYNAFQNADENTIHQLNDWFMASRETQEMRQETQQMGWSLLQLAESLEWCSPQRLNLLKGLDPACFSCVHAGLIEAQGISAQAGLTAYLFSWLENQVMAAMKSVPLGQMSGQRLIQQLRGTLAQVCEQAHHRATETPPRLYNFAPQFAIVAARHETQYSRLFRS
ncbi:MAG: urease accessory protein UreF [Pusillimonas sp.]|nr:urease accessory protein UreF [Pusillimonas sp.]